jgi:hypothetical protein
MTITKAREVCAAIHLYDVRAVATVGFVPRQEVLVIKLIERHALVGLDDVVRAGPLVDLLFVRESLGARLIS